MICRVSWRSATATTTLPDAVVVLILVIDESTSSTTLDEAEDGNPTWFDS